MKMFNKKSVVFVALGACVFLCSWVILTVISSFTQNDVPNVVVVANAEKPIRASMSDNWQDSALNNLAEDAVKGYSFDAKGRLESITGLTGGNEPIPEEIANNCVIVLGPVKDGKSSVIVASACGKVDALEPLENAGPVVLILYSGTSGTGSQLQLVASDPGGCNAGSYGTDLAPWGWDNIASSMRAYCSYGFIYDAAGYGPPAFWCTLGMCNGLGSLNNIGSSARASNSGLLNVDVNGSLP